MSKLTQSNGPLSTNQIVNHFVDHFASQIDKVQFDYVIALDMAKTTCPNWQGGLIGWFFLCLTLLDIFLLKNLVEKTVNCSSGSREEDIEATYEKLMSTLDILPKMSFVFLMYILGQ
jgi:hypothetical protein